MLKRTARRACGVRGRQLARWIVSDPTFSGVTALSKMSSAARWIRMHRSCVFFRSAPRTRIFGRNGDARVLRPGVPGILSHQLFSDSGVVPLPEPGQIGGDLDGTLVGCEQVQDDRDAAGVRRRL